MQVDPILLEYEHFVFPFGMFSIVLQVRRSSKAKQNFHLFYESKQTFVTHKFKEVYVEKKINYHLLT